MMGSSFLAQCAKKVQSYGEVGIQDLEFLPSYYAYNIVAFLSNFYTLQFQVISILCLFFPFMVVRIFSKCLSFDISTPQNMGGILCLLILPLLYEGYF